MNEDLSPSKETTTPTTSNILNIIEVNKAKPAIFLKPPTNEDLFGNASQQKPTQISTLVPMEVK